MLACSWTSLFVVLKSSCEYTVLTLFLFFYAVMLKRCQPVCVTLWKRCSSRREVCPLRTPSRCWQPWRRRANSRVRPGPDCDLYPLLLRVHIETAAANMLTAWYNPCWRIKVESSISQHQHTQAWKFIIALWQNNLSSKAHLLAFLELSTTCSRLYLAMKLAQVSSHNSHLILRSTSGCIEVLQL